MAEIAHPERPKPRFRELFRAPYISEFNYPVSEDDIDAMLFVDRNKNQPGYMSFLNGSIANGVYRSREKMRDRRAKPP